MRKRNVQNFTIEFILYIILSLSINKMGIYMYVKENFHPRKKKITSIRDDTEPEERS